ncbi:MAG: class I SAM-dependent methyltransferase [Acidimicrobiales bacterium]|nr:class I SAM-dependent methyltransferase [Acidimicrobiales bacterium]
MDRDAWNERYDTDELVWLADPNRFLPPEVADLTPGRALDIACGEGRNAIWLAAQGWEVTAVDFSDVAVAKGTRLAEQQGVNVDFVVADVTDWRPEADAYDLVVIFYLQLPEPQRGAVMERARAAVKPGGTFLLVAHDLSNLENGHGGPQSADVLPTPEIVVAHLPGFQVERATVVERTVEVDGDTKVALDTLVRARRA